jgi:hypothetical protein
MKLGITTWFIALAVCFVGLTAHAENTLIQGNAFYYKGKTIEVHRYLDLFTFETSLLDKQEIPQTGSFKFNIDVEKTGLYVLKIQNVHAHVYLEPGNAYTLVLSEPLEEERYGPAKDIFILPEVFEAESQLNHHITEIEKTINRFLIDNSKYYGRSVSRKILPLADSLVMLLNAQYGDHPNAFLREHLHFRLATLELQTNHSKNSVYDRYFSDHPIAYDQLSFAQGFGLFYDEYLEYLNPKQEQRFLEEAEAALEQADYDALYKALDVDPHLERREIRELLLATQLYELGTEKKYPLQTIRIMLDSLIMRAQDQACKVIAANAEQILNRLAPGTLAPDFQFSDLFGNIFRLKEYKGRYIYIQFFDDFDAETVKEMSLMKVLKEGYGTDIAMFSISTKASLARMRDIAGDYDFNWYFGRAMNHDQLVDQYQLRAFPSYFYLNKDMEIIVSPAPPPGGRIERMFAKAWNEEHPNKELLFKLQPPEVEEEALPK